MKITKRNGTVSIFDDEKVTNSIMKANGEDPSEKMTRKIIVSDILYVYSDSNYCIIHTKSGEQRVRISFTQLAKKLMSYPSFMEVGRGTAVNFDNTSHLSDTDCVMINGDCVPVSRRRIKAVEKAFLGRQFNKLLEEGE